VQLANKIQDQDIAPSLQVSNT